MSSDEEDATADPTPIRRRRRTASIERPAPSVTTRQKIKLDAASAEEDDSGDELEEAYHSVEMNEAADDGQVHDEESAAKGEADQVEDDALGCSMTIPMYIDPPKFGMTMTGFKPTARIHLDLLNLRNRLPAENAAQLTFSVYRLSPEFFKYIDKCIIPYMDQVSVGARDKPGLLPKIPKTKMTPGDCKLRTRTAMSFPLFSAWLIWPVPQVYGIPAIMWDAAVERCIQAQRSSKVASDAKYAKGTDPTRRPVSRMCFSEVFDKTIQYIARAGYDVDEKLLFPEIVLGTGALAEREIRESSPEQLNKRGPARKVVLKADHRQRLITIQSLPWVFAALTETRTDKCRIMNSPGMAYARIVDQLAVPLAEYFGSFDGGDIVTERMQCIRQTCEAARLANNALNMQVHTFSWYTAAQAAQVPELRQEIASMAKQLQELKDQMQALLAARGVTITTTTSTATGTSEDDNSTLEKKREREEGEDVEYEDDEIQPTFKRFKFFDSSDDNET